MTKSECAAEIEKQLDALGKLIKAVEPLNLYDITGDLKRGFEYILAADLHMKNRHMNLPEPPKPKLMRRTLF